MHYSIIFQTYFTTAIGVFNTIAKSPLLAAAILDQSSGGIGVSVGGAARNGSAWLRLADDYIRGEQRPILGDCAHASNQTAEA